MVKRVVVAAPGSIANLGPLFDIGALAVDAYHDVVTVEPADSGLHVLCEGGPSGEANIAFHAAKIFLEHCGVKGGFRVHVRKGVPIGVGLGSSGATAAATVYALNKILGEPLSLEELVVIAGEAEGFVAGTPHYDNVAASLCGGLTLVLDVEKRVVVKVEIPKEIVIILFKPMGLSMPKRKTEFMRSVLPDSISLREAVEWVSKALALVTGLLRHDIKSFRYSSEGFAVERARARYIPCYWEAKRAAIEHGALAFNIAGAGPTMFALVHEDMKDEVKTNVLKVFEKCGVRVDVVESRADNHGAKVVQEE